MKGLLRSTCPLLLLTALLFSACGRKDGEPAPAAQTEAPSAPDLEPAAPADAVAATAADPSPTPETAGPLTPMPESAAPAATVPGAPVTGSGAAAGASTDSEPAVPAAVAAADAAYEAWFRKYKLDLNDPNMLDADLDGDGVSNRDEFLADTNPLVAEGGKTGFHKDMRLKQFTEVKLPLVLEAVEGSTARIKRLDEPQARVETVRTGDTLRGLPFKVARLQAKRAVDKTGERVDLSRVTLEDPVTKEQTVLVKDMPARSSSSHAVLVSSDGASTLTVRVGDVFSWPGDEGVTYKVVDLRADQAVLEQVESGRMVTVPKK
jgi:hypothetical protein